MMDDNETKKPEKKEETKERTTLKSSKKRISSRGKVKTLKNEVEQLTHELDDLKDKYLRIIAEFDNYKKRKDREFLEIAERANQQLFLELLPIIDDFERSMNPVVKRKNYKSLQAGVQLIYQKLMAVLKQQGIEPIESIGHPFNPEVHEAIMQVEDDEKPSNTVVNEALKGYRLRDKLLRYSQVVVTK